MNTGSAGHNLSHVSGKRHMEPPLLSMGTALVAHAEEVGLMNYSIPNRDMPNATQQSNDLPYGIEGQQSNGTSIDRGSGESCS